MSRSSDTTTTVDFIFGINNSLTDASFSPLGASLDMLPPNKFIENYRGIKYATIGTPEMRNIFTWKRKVIPNVSNLRVMGPLWVSLYFLPNIGILCYTNSDILVLYFVCTLHAYSLINRR